MDPKRVLLAGIGGGIIFFLLGWLFYGMLLTDFFNANNAVPMKAQPDMLPMIIGNISWGLMLALIYDRWAGIRTARTGMIAGAVIGFLIAFSYNLMSLAATDYGNWTTAVVDSLVTAVMSGVAGAIVAYIIGQLYKD